VLLQTIREHQPRFIIVRVGNNCFDEVIDFHDLDLGDGARMNSRIQSPAKEMSAGLNKQYQCTNRAEDAKKMLSGMILGWAPNHR
jgi:hypothetical protein